MATLFHHPDIQPWSSRCIALRKPKSFEIPEFQEDQSSRAKSKAAFDLTNGERRQCERRQADHDITNSKPDPG
jgi:hypothetical protein